MDEPRTGRSRRRLALLLAVPIAVVTVWVSVAAAGGSSSHGKARADVAKPAKVEKKRYARAGFSTHGKGDCPFEDAQVTRADI